MLFQDKTTPAVLWTFSPATWRVQLPGKSIAIITFYSTVHHLSTPKIKDTRILKLLLSRQMKPALHQQANKTRF